METSRNLVRKGLVDVRGHNLVLPLATCREIVRLMEEGGAGPSSLQKPSPSPQPSLDFPQAPPSEAPSDPQIPAALDPASLLRQAYAPAPAKTLSLPAVPAPPPARHRKKASLGAAGLTEIGPGARFDRDFLFSARGLLKFAQLLFAVVFCGLVGTFCTTETVDGGVIRRSCFRASYLYDRGFAGLGFELFVGAVSVLLSALFLVLNLFAPRSSSSRPWVLPELLYTALVAFLFFVSWCIHAKYTADQRLTQLFDQYIAGTVFGFCLFVFYAIDLCLQMSAFCEDI